MATRRARTSRSLAVRPPRRGPTHDAVAAGLGRHLEQQPDVHVTSRGGTDLKVALLRASLAVPARSAEDAGG